MYCKNCGNKLNENDMFCGNCGHPTTLMQKEELDVLKSHETERTKVDDNTMLFQVKPTFKLGYRLLIHIRGLRVLLPVMLLFLIPLYGEGILKKIIDENPLSTIIFYIIFFIIIYVAIKTILDYFQYKELEYNFYNKKIVYKNGFLNKIEKEIQYKDIKEINTYEGVLERMFKLGIIIISTSASSAGNGLLIHSVENVNEEYQKINILKEETKNKY